MFELIKGWFSNDLLVELSAEKITVRTFGSPERLEMEPWVALQGAGQSAVIMAIGREAKTLTAPETKAVNPFTHARSFVGNFMLAEKVLQHCIQQLHRKGFRPAPRVVMHQLEKADGGLTDIEDRVLRELAVGAGAREVLVYTGAQTHVQSISYDDFKSKLNVS